MTPILTRLAATLIVAVPFAGHAAEMKISGTGTYVTVDQDTVSLPDGRSITHLRQKGLVLSDDPSSPIHLAVADCFATVVVAADGKSYELTGYCSDIDRDGDVWWVAFSDGAGGPHWSILRGLGKYEGMTGSGTFRVDIETPDGRASETYSGTITLK